MATAKPRGLGKGLEALFNNVEISGADIDNTNPNTEGGVVYIDINEIKPNAQQPRKHFNDEKIEELAKSIEAHGVIQPIMVRTSSSGYEIVAGERRWRAARRAGLKKVPCIIRELSEEQNMLIAIIENMQREDLNPMEEAEALNQMITRFGLTQEEVSKSVGKSRPYITNSLRLLKLPNAIQDMVSQGKLTSGHARAIAGIKSEARQLAVAEAAISTGMSVREVELLAGEEGKEAKEKRSKGKAREKARELVNLEEDLKAVFGTKVSITPGVKGGKIEIEYYSKEELEGLLEMLLNLK